MSLFYGNGIALTEKTLDLLWGRQNITVNNIANVDTPNYKSKYLTFENELLTVSPLRKRADRKKFMLLGQSTGKELGYTARETNPAGWTATT